MPRAQLITTNRSRHSAVPTETPNSRIYDSDEVDPMVGMSLETARAQVDEACRDMEEFHQLDPDQIMRSASRHLARMNTIRIRSMRVARTRPAWKDFQIREMEPVVEELRRQCAIGSRLHAVRDLAVRTDIAAR